MQPRDKAKDGGATTMDRINLAPKASPTNARSRHDELTNDRNDGSCGVDLFGSFNENVGGADGGGVIVPPPPLGAHRSRTSSRDGLGDNNPSRSSSSLGNNSSNNNSNNANAANSNSNPGGSADTRRDSSAAATIVTAGGRTRDRPGIEFISFCRGERVGGPYAATDAGGGGEDDRNRNAIRIAYGSGPIARLPTWRRFLSLGPTDASNGVGCLGYASSARLRLAVWGGAVTVASIKINATIKRQAGGDNFSVGWPRLA